MRTSVKLLALVMAGFCLVNCSSSDKNKKAAPLNKPYAKMQAAAMVGMPAPMAVAAPQLDEKYQALPENAVKQAEKESVSTFSIDVDTASYANLRRFLKQGQLPPVDAVRVEEMINYFPYEPTTKNSEHPFGVQTELSSAPWNSEHQLLRIRLQAMDANTQTLPPCNLIFLVDVSGSMADTQKLPLVKSTLKMLVNQLRPQDKISLIVYAGRTQVELPATSGAEKAKIIAAINKLTAEGSTAGESAIRLAYDMARANYMPNGINRILLATDGDFNVGITDIKQLKDLVAAERKTGISLTTLGFGEGNYNDYLMEQIADVGNGNSAYIDSVDEGRKVLLQEMQSTFNTVAGDVKVQVEFNPEQVSEYRLIGYENRLLKEEDFNNDQVDAGELGAGKTVTALYEITPIGKTGLIDPHRYGPNTAVNKPKPSPEMAFIKLRYKKPGSETSQLMTTPVLASQALAPEKTSADFKFSAAVAAFGQRLKNSVYLNQYDYPAMIQLAQAGRGTDTEGYRAEAIRLMQVAQGLSPQKPQ